MRAAKMLERIINIRLISHPLNWLIVAVFVMIWGLGLSIIREGMAGGCGCDNGIPD
jgi:hypothetical protein